MDFGLSEDQELLQQSARDFLAAECPPSLVRELASDEEGFPRALYAKMAALGWMGLIVPERYGGAGLGMLELALLLEQLGRVLMPGPFLSSAVLATLAIARGGSPSQRQRWLPRLARGEVVGALALLEESDWLDASGVRARARRRGGGWRLSGTKLFATDAHVAEVLVGVFRSRGDGADGITLFAVPRATPGLAVTPMSSIDPTRRPMAVQFDDVDLPTDAVLGTPHGGWRTVARVLDAAAIGIAADCLGGAARALELAVEYSRTRRQFGQPIGSFQAIKHLAAEMVSEIEPARALVWYAAYAYDALPREAPRAAAMVKALLSEVYSRTANRAVQMHGGIGFTWEHDIHFWLKRAKSNEVTFGDPTFYRQRLAQLSRF
jgi:alkylation response protein AidB-like acyl-CoA dehydrogenase